MKNEFMNLAIEKAKQAFSYDEVPVGCVIVYNNIILSATYNQKEKSQSVTKHAEILAVEEASKKINNWRLEGCDVYITLEPCPMCASALKQARVKNIFCGLTNSDSSNTNIVREILKKDKTNPEVNIITNLAVDKVEKLMKQFFINRRNN